MYNMKNYSIVSICFVIFNILLSHKYYSDILKCYLSIDVYKYGFIKIIFF